MVERFVAGGDTVIGGAVNGEGAGWSAASVNLSLFGDGLGAVTGLQYLVEDPARALMKPFAVPPPLH